MKAVPILMILPCTLLAADFFDNFESLSQGDNLDSSYYWLQLDPGGSRIPSDEAGDMFTEPVWNGYNYFGYVCLGSAIWSDGAVSADIKFTGSEAPLGFLARADAVTGEAYMGGIYPVLPPIGATVIAYVDSAGGYEILTNDFLYPLSADTWYNVSFEITGSGPVNLELSVNGTVNSSFQDGTHDLGPGACGIGGVFETTAPMFYIDDFNVDDFNTAMARTTFGAIKALFQ